ncbi:MAG: hypothetical protein IT429_20325 [Gemmataceae bacterium]|nr:hypothetical protein [Gemmataceae bacterium]
MSARMLSAAVLGIALAWVGGAAAQGPKPNPAALVVIDNAGKEVKVANWTFLAGTRHLSWLAERQPNKDVPSGKKGEKEPAQKAAPVGPEALEFREEKSTSYKDGVLTLIPLASIKRIDYDLDKKTVQVTYLHAGAKGPEEGVLTGTTRFVGINKVALEGEADLGELGKAAIKYRGGDAKGVRSIQFPAPQPTAEPTGTPSVVTVEDGGTATVRDLRPLYALGREGEKRIDTLRFKTTVKIDVGKIDKLRYAGPAGKKALPLEFEVTLKDGKQHALTLLQDASPEDGKAGRLQGLVGRVPAGWKLFPAHTLVEVQFGRVEAAPEKKNGERP